MAAWKKLLADQALDLAILNETSSAKLLSPPLRRQAVKDVCQAMRASERSCVSGSWTSIDPTATASNLGSQMDEPIQGFPDAAVSRRVRPSWLSADHGAVAPAGVAGEPQAGRENLAAGGTESAEETAPQRPAVVERWVMPSVKTVLAGSCLGVQFCGRSISTMVVRRRS